MSKPNEYGTYIIPPNFIEGGTFFGGLLKLRNTAEALVIVLAIGMPVFSVSALTLTAKIIILCLTALPLGIIALVGINGESLSSFIFLVLKYLCNRRVITRNEEEQDKRKKRRKRKAKSGDDAPKYINPVAEYLPVEKIENGIIYTRDHRYLKFVEVIPINFLLRSAREQRNIIYSFISFLKISPVKMQIKVIAKRADLNRHREIVQREMARETDENCRLLQQDYLTLIDRIGAREATSRRFFMVFEYEAWAGRKRDNEEAEAIASLQTAARTAVNYLKQCGNEVLIPENDDEFTVDTLYHLLCRNTTTSLPDRVRRIVAQYQEKGLESEIDAIPCTEFFAPDSIDFTNGRHICIDGLYYAYLLVPSTGYKAQVLAGWLSLIVNAGDGIDLDMFISRQPKARMVQRLGQQLRINRSKIKDASDTNTDFDDLDGAIRSGYFLKEGLGNNEDFYYLNLLIAVSAPTVDELEWKVNELKKLLVSRDMDVCSCAFHEEQAFLSSLPLVSMEKHLFERSKRNALTTGVASCYPFMSYELSDENGILFGLNKYNNSPVIIDIFDSKVYKNANIAVCGTSGAGKTSLILLMALRMRRKGIQVFMLAPLKGHEFHRACVNTGGEFISISPASKSCINVLEIRKIDKSVEGTLTVSADAQVTATLPYGEWFGNIRLLDVDQEPYRAAQNRANHTAQYWIEDTANALSSVYLNVVMGNVPNTKTTKLRTIYTGTNGKDMSGTSRSWNSTATSLTYLLTSGMGGKTFALEAQYTGSDGYTQIQSYDVTVTRVPTLKALAATAEGTKLPLEFAPNTREYSLKTVSSTVDIDAAPFGEDYTVTGTGAVQLTGDTQDHMIQVAAPNGEQSTYTLHIQKVASVPVTLAVPSGTTVQVINGAGSEIAPVDGIYHLVPGESYTCIATKNTWYHTQITFTASSGLNVSVPEPVTTDWLTDLAFYNGTYASSRIAYAADKTFTAADHTYNYTVSDCNSSVAMQATATGTVTALYRAQSTVPEIHNLARMETITTPVSKTGLAQSLTYAVAKAGYGQTVTIRISKTENGTTYYQDYDIQLLRQLHLSSLTIATKDETLPFVTPKGATARFDRDTTDYYVKVDRETAALYLSGTYPNSSTDTACCGGYYAKVNGVRYDTLAGAEAVLNTDLYNEDISVQVCHADTGSIELTYTVHVQKSDPIQLTIQTTPADATVFLTNDLNGKRIVEKNGTYSLTPGASYSYTTTCAGYIGQTVEHYTAPDKDGTLTITLKKAPANDKLINFDSAWPHLRQNNENNGVVDYKTPVYAKDAELYWATSIGSGYDVNACGCPILVDGAIYTYSGSRIYKVDAISGEILIDKPMDHNSSFAINPPTYANGMIFVGLSDGTIQAFDANTLDSLWIYRDSIGGQPNSSIVYHDGYIYTGFWVGEINEAHYVCLSATDEDPTQTMEEKLPTWYYTSKGGFYWAGAYVCDDFLLIGTDDGASGYTAGKPSLLSFNPKTGELLSSYKMNVTGDIRSSITHYNGKYYFTSKGGYFYEATVDEKGTIEDVRTLKLYNYADDPANPAMSTCTPTIYNGRAYIGISGTAQFGAYSGHNLTVIDIPNWEIAYTVRTHGYPQTSGVLTTAYMEETGCVYVYFFDNFTPDKLRVLEDKPGQTEVSLKTMETYTASGQTETYTTPYNIFTPSGAQAQYAICSPIMDEYGTIYFKNDSAYLMAVGSTIERIEVTKLPDKTTYNVKDTFDPTGMQVTAYYANGMTRDVTKYVTWSDKPLKASDTDFQITFPYAMYQNRENSDTLEMECGVHCDKPMTTLTLTIADQSAVKYGDVNADGIIDVSDAMLICQIYLGNVTPTDTQKKAADVNGDGTMDVSDAMMVCQYYLGNITKFPVEQ